MLYVKKKQKDKKQRKKRRSRQKRTFSKEASHKLSTRELRQLVKKR